MRSLPSRERGLKFKNDEYKKRVEESLPSRERGLKFVDVLVQLLLVPSLPSRERGLKFKFNFSNTSLNIVAPLAGAWIEIISPR